MNNLTPELWQRNQAEEMRNLEKIFFFLIKDILS